MPDHDHAARKTCLKEFCRWLNFRNVIVFTVEDSRCPETADMDPFDVKDSSASRLKEITCDLMEMEIQVWEDIDRQQQAKVDAEREKLDQLTEQVLQARALYEARASALAAGMASSAKRGPSSRLVDDKSTQTDPVQEVNEGELEEEVNSLRQEVQTLQAAADLMLERKRLEDEVREGESFKRLREARRREEAMCVDLDKKIAELEAILRGASSAQAADNNAMSETSATATVSAAHYSQESQVVGNLAPWDVDEPPEPQPPGPQRYGNTENSRKVDYSGGPAVAVVRSALTAPRTASVAASRTASVAAPRTATTAAGQSTGTAGAEPTPSSRTKSRFVPKQAILFGKLPPTQ